MTRGRGHWAAKIPDSVYKDRLWSRCEIQANGCWIYQGTQTSNGYGLLCYRNKAWRTHRLAFKLWHGDVPAGHFVCHTCDTPLCCNPAHLFAGTPLQNTRDSVRKGRTRNQKKTHCPRGHALEGDNLRIHPKTGWRRCETCARARQRITAGWPADLAYSAPRNTAYKSGPAL